MTYMKLCGEAWTTSATKTTGRGWRGLQYFGRRAALSTTMLEFERWAWTSAMTGRTFILGDKMDLVYSGMNFDYVLHFLIKDVTKADGKLKSFQDVRKYRDAILWRSKVAEQQMPQTFFEKTDIYLEAYKKKFLVEKKAGNVDEYTTDPIPMPVY
jgi:hypothetical protein